MEKVETRLLSCKKIQELESKCPRHMIFIQVQNVQILHRLFQKMVVALIKYDLFACFTGTSERVCLITGSLEAIMAVMDFIMDKIREKPDLTLKTTVDFESGKTTAERDKQVTICFLCCCIDKSVAF